MVSTRSAEARSDDTLLRVEGLEKAVADLKVEFNEKFDILLKEIRASQTNVPHKDPLDHEADDASAAGDASSPPNGTQHPMALPSFDGRDALGWLARVGQYFMVHKTTDANRMDLALIALSGPALPWIQILHRRFPSLSWDQFSRELLIRFSDDSARDSYEALAATKHDGSLADFIAAFESHLAQLPDLTDNQFLGFFLAKLKPHIRLQLTDHGIATYSDAVQMAKRIERLSTPLTSPNSSGNSFSQSSTQHSSYPLQAHSRPPQQPAPYSPNSSMVPNSGGHTYSNTASSFAPPSGSRPNHRFRHMSQEDYQKHRAAGTCFQCGLKYSPTHRCPPKTLQVIVLNDDDDAINEEFETGVDSVRDLSPQPWGQGCFSPGGN